MGFYVVKTKVATKSRPRFSTLKPAFREAKSAREARSFALRAKPGFASKSWKNLGFTPPKEDAIQTTLCRAKRDSRAKRERVGGGARDIVGARDDVGGLTPTTQWWGSKARASEGLEVPPRKGHFQPESARALSGGKTFLRPQEACAGSPSSGEL